MFGYEFLFTFSIVMNLIQMKVMNKGKEALHDKMRSFIADAVKCDMFSTFEDVVTVVIKYFLQQIQSGVWEYSEIVWELK
jgi:hypothetical protein